MKTLEEACHTFMSCGADRNIRAVEWFERNRHLTNEIGNSEPATLLVELLMGEIADAWKVEPQSDRDFIEPVDTALRKAFIYGVIVGMEMEKQ